MVILSPASVCADQPRASSAPRRSSRVRQRAPGGSVVFYCCTPGRAASPDHDTATKCAVARSIAELLGLRYAGPVEDGDALGGAGLYVVPSDTLTAAQAARLGIRGPQDFFGGVVPHPFVATKVISHPLPPGAVAAPQGWSPSHGEAIADVVLPGFSAFAPEDARRGALALLARGAVRLKQPGGVGGAGQAVVRDAAQLDAQLARIDPGELRREGLVVELNLAEPLTFSVGQVRIGPWTASYVGTQRQTLNAQGDEVYGGSRLTVLRGGFGALLARGGLRGALRAAVEQAMRYHDSVQRSFPGMFASRCNYDVVSGRDESGEVLGGVLEQSWRIGGASGAELAALHALRRDPSLAAVRASTREVYGGSAQAPRGAWVHFEGVDRHGQHLLKYVRARNCARPDDAFDEHLRGAADDEDEDDGEDIDMREDANEDRDGPGNL